MGASKSSLQTPGRVWVIDTSSVIQVRRLPDTNAARQNTIYERLTELAADGSLVFPKQVADELERNASTEYEDLPLKWAKTVQSIATRYGTDYDQVRAVLSVASEVLDHTKTTEEADPYVLALGQQLAQAGHSTTVITEENKDKPDKMSLSTACGLLGLPCVPLAAFLKSRGLWSWPKP